MIEKIDIIADLDQIKDLGNKINDALKYNDIYTRCLHCNTTLLVNDSLWKRHFREIHLEFYNYKKGGQCIYDENCNFKGNPSSLNTHLLSHIQAKVFQCNICNLYFCTSSVLASHKCKETKKVMLEKLVKIPIRKKMILI